MSQHDDALAAAGEGVVMSRYAGEVFTVFEVQGAILTAVTLALFVVKAWAFLDAVSHRAEAFPAADKMTKKAWLVILGVTLAAHMIFWDPINFLNIIGTVAALVYMVDARPALKSLTQR
jgi:hypothetical protein